MQRTRNKLAKFISASVLAVAATTAVAQNDTEKNFFLDDPPAAPGTTPVAPAVKVDEPKKSTPVVSDSNTSDTTPADSHPYFDWSKHQGETEVQHPLAEKGLVEITKDRTYIYNVKQKEGHHSGSLHIGLFNPTNLHNPDSNDRSNFSDNYNNGSNLLLMFDYEWQLFRIGIGKVGFVLGGGMFFAQGHGHFLNPSSLPAGQQTPPETFTLMVFPINVGATYRMQFWDRQMIVPYGAGGATLYPFTEIRDDGHGPKFAGSAGIYFAAGGALNLTYFDKFSALSLGRQYGINRVYLFGEFRETVNVARYDFGGPMINFGFTADF